jgi:hypothetical protein
VVEAEILLPIPNLEEVEILLPRARHYLHEVYWQSFTGRLADIDHICTRIAAAVHQELLDPDLYNRFPVRDARD